MNLTPEQKTQIRSWFFDNVKDAEKRTRILSTAFGYADGGDDDGDLEDMVWYLSQPENADKIDELFAKFASNTIEDFNYGENPTESEA